MPLQENKAYMLKTAFLESAFQASVLTIEPSGVWVKSPEMTSLIHREAAGLGVGASVPASKEFLRAFPKLFVPFHQIQWIGGPEM